MTPKQKRRLAQQAQVLDMLWETTRDVLDAPIIAGVAKELHALSAESPPKCGTCERKFIGPDGDLVCSESRGGPFTRYVKPDFGCVLHSEYEEP